MKHKISYKVIFINLFLLISFFDSFAQEFYKFRKEKKSYKGFSVTPLVGLKLSPAEENSFAAYGITFQYAFSSYFKTSIAYTRSSRTEEYYTYYFWGSSYSKRKVNENRFYLNFGAMYPITKFIALDGALGMSYGINDEFSPCTHFGISFRLSNTVSLRPEFIGFTDNIILGLGTKINLKL
jgi:hypothetical protein